VHGSEATPGSSRPAILNRFERGLMARRNLPDLTFEVVRAAPNWGLWLVVVLAGALGVFALTALIATLLIHG
jgi:hypothetical protein